MQIAAQKNFRQITFPSGYEYQSDGPHLPIEFYIEVFPKSKEVYLKLGYFSSSAIRVLALSFAQFIYNGGAIKIVTNHYLYDRDKQLLNIVDVNEDAVVEANIAHDIEWIYKRLSGEEQHFLDCLKYLAKMDRLEIIPVILKPNSMAHYKQGIFIDRANDSIFMDGSCNFTAKGLLENAESISIYRSWGSDFEADKVSAKKQDLKDIAFRASSQYEYLYKEQIQNAITKIGKDRNVLELLRQEVSLCEGATNSYTGRVARTIERYQNELDEIIKQAESTPKFPFNSTPREYQVEACSAWRMANKQGVFAMATGTGKTITALNCLLSEYEQDGTYQAVILVPTKVLVDQWRAEAHLFNFTNVYLVYSDSDWKKELRELCASLRFNQSLSFILIVTYQTFPTDGFQKYAKQLPSSTILIADEAHNIGSRLMKRSLENINWARRLALSATPKRIYDEEGNSAIEKFFCSTEPYTYSFSLDRAIEDGYLCHYLYFPHIVELTDDEQDEYIAISKKLASFFNINDGVLKKNESVERLLLARKRIVHKAANKLSAFQRILEGYVACGEELKYAFVYAPEGEDAEGTNILAKYINKLSDTYPSVRAYAYTSQSQDRETILQNFESGYFDVLFSMKCLDEGVDIPRAQLAIFCSSTGNPRQFIQRRGRVLRNHIDKTVAIIHDLVVVPAATGDWATHNVEKSLLRQELIRVVYFASLANNYYEAMDICNQAAQKYDLDIYALQDELRSAS